MGDAWNVPPPGRQEDFVEQLCRAHEQQLLLYLTRMLGHVELAREVAQDTYEQLHRSYKPDQVMFPRAMLFKIATNFALMLLRRKRLENAVVTGDAGMDQVADERARPDRQAMADEVSHRLVQVIKDLHPNLRNVFVMAHVQGKSRKDIADELGISMKRVDKRMTRALKRCREELESYGIDLLRVD